MNMILHGIEAPNVMDTNTVTKYLGDISDKDRFDVIRPIFRFGVAKAIAIMPSRMNLLRSNHICDWQTASTDS